MQDGGSLVVGRTKAEAAYVQLRQQIMDGTLPPGATVDQGTLARSLSISTTPVREALRRLEAEHLVVVRPHYGPRVAPLPTSELHQLFAVRLELDPLAAGLAAAHASQVQRAHVREILNRPVTSAPESVARDRQFHGAVFNACGNPVLVQILDSLWHRCDRYRFLLVKTPSSDGHGPSEHQDILAALEAGDAMRLRTLMRTHVEHSYARLAALAHEYSQESAGR